MKYLFLMLLAVPMLQAQNSEPQIEPCASALFHDRALLLDTVYAQKMRQFEARVKQPTSRQANINQVLIIPAVVHVMHKGEALGVGTNITDQAVYNRLKSINENFRKKIGSDGYANGVDTEIEFALAVRDPNGLCTNGIERIDMSSDATYMSSGVRIQSVNGITSTQLKSISSWDTTRYYNIYLISEFDNNNAGSGLQGYSDFATNHGQPYDGLMALTTPSAAMPMGNIETHELGHALNLYHTFEGDGTFGITCPSANGCGSAQGDCCADTPAHAHGNSNNCIASATNACDGGSSNALFTYNYMNYCTTQNMFTADQKNRMRTAITTLRGSYLMENGNTSLLPTQSPTAQYEASAQTICAGESIQFFDRSSCIPNLFSNNSIGASMGFDWVFTNGTTTVTSTIQNPVLKFTQPGNYNLTYTVTNAFGTHTLTVPNAVVVNSMSVLACTPESDFIGQSGYSIFSVVFNTIANYTPQGHSQGYREFSCTKNTVVDAHQTYYLQLKASSFTFLGATLYTVAYIDYNSNGTFEPNEKIFEAQLAPGNSSYTYDTPVVIPDTAVKGVYLRMRIIGSTTPITDALMNCATHYERGDIEDYAVLIADPMSNQDFGYQQQLLSPNPVRNNLTIDSKTSLDKIQIYSNVGQLIFDQNYPQNQVIVDTTLYASGIYFVVIESKGQRYYYKIVKE